MPPAPVLMPVHRPMLTVPMVATIADKSVKQVKLLIEEGRLTMVFNIAQQESSARKCLRVTTTCLAEYLANPAAVRSESPDALARTVETLFPSLCLTYRSEFVARTLNTSDGQLFRLIRAGRLEVARPGRAGQGCAALITRKSCVDLLISRRVA